MKLTFDDIGAFIGDVTLADASLQPPLELLDTHISEGRTYKAATVAMLLTGGAFWACLRWVQWEMEARGVIDVMDALEAEMAEGSEDTRSLIAIMQTGYFKTARLDVKRRTGETDERVHAWVNDQIVKHRSPRNFTLAETTSNSFRDIIEERDAVIAGLREQLLAQARTIRTLQKPLL